MVADIPLDIKVAVMGCAVNGPGEAKEADIGIAGGTFSAFHMYSFSISLSLTRYILKKSFFFVEETRSTIVSSKSCFTLSSTCNEGNTSKNFFTVHLSYPISPNGAILLSKRKGLGIILYQGIGDTIRVSLTGDPVEEIKSAKLIGKKLFFRYFFNNFPISDCL